MGVARLFTDPYFPLLIQGVTSACNAQDHSVMLWLAEPEYERRMIGEIFHSGLLDGLIVSSMMIDDPVVQALVRGRLPFILIGRHLADDNTSFVDVDNHSSARDAVTRLLRQGRRRVAVITGPETMVGGLDRLNGYVAALRDRGMTPDPGLKADGDFTEPGGYAAARQLLPRSPDAIFACSDAMAIGALRALREAGLRVPEDVALMGFDDIPQAAHTDPPLTTVRQPIHRLGATAVDTLIDLIERPEAGPHRIVLPTDLVIRSTA
jgi:LacI family transcriptional regulator